jgi:hypothetical protein
VSAHHVHHRLQVGAVDHPDLHLADVLHLRPDLLQQLAHVLHRLVGLRAGISRPDQLALGRVDRVSHLAAHEDAVAGKHHAAHIGLDVAFRMLIADIVKAMAFVGHGKERTA